ncbi:MAG TPA: type II toxin-antitoxin system HicA family toxin [Rhizomicrobium sp.]|nr:type II toxin-antitoxin system HicA family toxin [Rhizomicrobium sp.]
MRLRLPAASARKVIRALQRAGFVIHHTTGGHTIMRHVSDLTLRVTVPMHNGDLRSSTMRMIIKQSGLSIDQFIEFL